MLALKNCNLYTLSSIIEFYIGQVDIDKDVGDDISTINVILNKSHRLIQIKSHKFSLIGAKNEAKFTLKNIESKTLLSWACKYFKSRKRRKQCDIYRPKRRKLCLYSISDQNYKVIFFQN